MTSGEPYGRNNYVVRHGLTRPPSSHFINSLDARVALSQFSYPPVNRSADPHHPGRLTHVDVRIRPFVIPCRRLCGLATLRPPQSTYTLLLLQGRGEHYVHILWCKEEEEINKATAFGVIIHRRTETGEEAMTKSTQSGFSIGPELALHDKIAPFCLLLIPRAVFGHSFRLLDMRTHRRKFVAGPALVELCTPGLRPGARRVGDSRSKPDYIDPMATPCPRLPKCNYSNTLYTYCDPFSSLSQVSNTSSPTCSFQVLHHGRQSQHPRICRLQQPSAEQIARQNPSFLCLFFGRKEYGFKVRRPRFQSTRERCQGYPKSQESRFEHPL